MVFYPLQREVSLEDTKVNQLPSLFISTLLHNLNYSVEGRSNPETVDKERVVVRHLRQAVVTRSGNFFLLIQ